MKIPRIALILASLPLASAGAESLGSSLELVQKAAETEAEIDVDAALEAVATLGQASGEGQEKEKALQALVQLIERQQPVRVAGSPSRIPSLMLLKSAAVAALHQIGDKRALGPLKAFQVKEGKTRYFPEAGVDQAIASLARLPGEQDSLSPKPEEGSDPAAWRVPWQKKEEGHRFLRLADQMAEGTHAQREQARDALMRSGNPVVPFLVDCLHRHPHFVGRRSSAYLLGQINDPLTVPDLVRALDEADENVLWTVITSLGFMEDQRATEKTIPHLDHPVERIRVAAAQALVRLRDPKSIESLETHIRKYSAGISRARAAEALGAIGDRRALPSLLRTMKDKHLVTREHAAMAYGKIASEQDLEGILEKLAAGELAASEVRLAIEEHYQADLELDEKLPPKKQIESIRMQIQELKEGKTIQTRVPPKSSMEKELEEGPLE